MQAVMDATLKITISHGIAMVVMDIALVVVGILLLQQKELGRKLAIAWAATAFVVLIGRAISFELVLAPVLDAFMKGLATQGGAQPMANQGLFSVVARAGNYLSLGFMAVYPMALMITMNLRSVKEAVAPEPSA